MSSLHDDYSFWATTRFLRKIVKIRRYVIWKYHGRIWEYYVIDFGPRNSTQLAFQEIVGRSMKFRWSKNSGEVYLIYIQYSHLHTLAGYRMDAGYHERLRVKRDAEIDAQVCLKKNSRWRNHCCAYLLNRLNQPCDRRMFRKVWKVPWIQKNAHLIQNHDQRLKNDCLKQIIQFIHSMAVFRP